MSQTFYFYDLETSGIDPRNDRVMQFAGQRTNAALEPVGEPHNVHIAMTPDVVPQPQAIMITGITPQKTIADGITERAFLELFYEQIATPETIFVGYNNVRFDDEFIRFMHYRNFYDAYEWQWKDGRSRWDLLDVVRMTRALRPEGITWPVDEAGKATNRLELLTQENDLDHANAHDALSDVYATISIARLIQQKQPKLFSFLLAARDKKVVSSIVDTGKPFVYTSGKYNHETEKTTVVAKLGNHPNGHAGSSLVFDLRYDPREYSELSPKDLVECMRRRHDDPGLKLPIKTLQHNRCPAVAPVTVLDTASKKRLQIDEQTYMANFSHLRSIQDQLLESVAQALQLLDKERDEKKAGVKAVADNQLYDGFFGTDDKSAMALVRSSGETIDNEIIQTIKDDRLKEILPLYKARNFPEALSSEEHEAWEAYRRKTLLEGELDSKLARYFDELARLAADKSLTTEQQFILEELQLYGQSIMPDIE